LLALLPLFWASLVSAAGPVVPTPIPASEPTTAHGYAATVAEIEALDQAINAGEDVRGPLFDALARLSGYAPSLAADPRARAIRTRAQLNLARIYLAEGGTVSAAGILDEVLRASMGEELPVAEFGPSLAALHDRRRAALEAAGTAGIGIECPSPVQAFIDEQAVAGETRGLYLGVYRVTLLVAGAAGDVGDDGDDADDGDDGDAGIDETHGLERHWVQLRQPGERVRVACRVATPASPPDDLAISARTERLLPRTVELGLVVFGAGVMTSGGLLLGLGDTRDRSQVIAGATLAGLGGAALMFGSIGFAVDEIRIGQARGRQALLHWRVEF
jgi:hypothetical protein